MLRTLIPAAALFASSATAVQAGSIQDDIESCGQAAVEAGLLPESGYSLRFLSDEGNRNRTLRLKVVGTDEAQAPVLECRMMRSKVREVVIAE